MEADVKDNLQLFVQIFTLLTLSRSYQKHRLKPIPLNFYGNNTLDRIGIRMVHTRKLKWYRMSNFHQLVLFLSLHFAKCSPRIDEHTFHTHPTKYVSTCKEQRWMNDLIILCVERVVKPYVANDPNNVVPSIVLVSYHCHLMASMVEIIHVLGVEVENVCKFTSLCQTVDVGCYKPWKKRIKE